MNKAFQYRIYPNKSQQHILSCIFGSCRFVYNFFLSMRRAEYAIGYNNVSYTECCRQLTLLKKEPGYEWLQDSDSTALQTAIRNLDNAYQNFFRGTGKYPRFHSKKEHSDSYTAKNNNDSIRLMDKHVRLPKVGIVKTKVSRPAEGRILSATVRRVPSGKYYVSVLCDCPEPEALPKTEEAVGIDMGVHDFLTLSDGTKIGNPKYLEASLKKLSHEQCKLSRKTKGSRNFERQRIKVARIQEHIAFQRKDFLNKLSTEIVRQYDTIGVEDLSVRSMLEDRKGLSDKQSETVHRHTAQTGIGIFLTMLQYKAEWYGRKIVRADRYFASSQICSECGAKNRDVRDLHIRVWICPVCGSVQERDVNAAVNLREYALSH